MTNENEYYSLDEIKKKQALYNVIFGERSNGKTFSVLNEILQHHLKHPTRCSAVIRREDEDFKSGRGKSMFAGIVNAGKLADTQWDNIELRGEAWYLYYIDEEMDKKIYDEYPLAYRFSISNSEHYKSSSYPTIDIILFDEFITRKFYLYDEFISFTNLISTIIRRRDDVTIYMCANTVNKNCPYFKEMGLTHVKDMKQGTIDLYEYGDTGLTVAVEWCENKVSKASDVYFAFDNPKLKMITSGAWQISVYPLMYQNYDKKKVNSKYYILWEDSTLECNIINDDGNWFTYIRNVGRDYVIGNLDDELIFSTVPDIRRNYKRRITQPDDKICRRLYRFFLEDKVFYDSNDTGEIVRYYLQDCMQFSVIKS